MKLLFETQDGSSFEIEVDNSDTLLIVKQKIETSQYIPVSKQVLAVDGVVIFAEDFTVEQCEISEETPLQFFVSLEQNPNLPREQSPEPFMSVEDYIAIQDSYQPVMMAQTEESTTSSNTNVQDSAVKNNDQSQPSDAAKQIIVNRNQDSTAATTVQTDESTSSSNSVGENSNVQDSAVRNNDQSQPSDAANQIIINSTNQETTEESTPYVNIHKIIIAIRVSYVRDGHQRRFVTTVNKKDHVRRLRHKVHGLDYEYVFKHKERVLDEDQSYESNGILFLNTIEVVRNP